MTKYATDKELAELELLSEKRYTRGGYLDINTNANYLGKLESLMPKLIAATRDLKMIRKNLKAIQLGFDDEDLCHDSIPSQNQSE